MSTNMNLGFSPHEVRLVPKREHKTALFISLIQFDSPALDSHGGRSVVLSGSLSDIASAVYPETSLRKMLIGVASIGFCGSCSSYPTLVCMIRQRIS
jgi:hypothetical protein